MQNKTNKKLNDALEALHVAETKEVSSKAEKDASHARIQLFLTQLATIQTSVKDIQDDSNRVKLEHEEILDMARDLERKTMSTQIALEKYQRKCESLKEEKDNIHLQFTTMQSQYVKAEQQFRNVQDELEKDRKIALTMEEALNTKKLQLENLEKELREARSLLITATNSTAENESTTSVLKETIIKLQGENKKLHEANQERIENNEKERKKKDDNLISIEVEAQELRIKVASLEEESKRMKLDKEEFEKYIEDLKRKSINLEKRLIDRQCQQILEVNMVGAKEEDEIKGNIPKLHNSLNLKKKAVENENCLKTINCLNGIKQTTEYMVSSNKRCPSDKVYPRTRGHNGTSNTDPQRDRVPFSFSKTDNDGKNQSQPRKKENICAICKKNAYGLMKHCQCGNHFCNQRAHASCISGKARKLNSSIDQVLIFCSTG